MELERVREGSDETSHCGPRVVPADRHPVEGGARPLHPMGGAMFVRCSKCGADLGAVPVPHGDPADGMTSHGLCGPCERESWHEAEAYLRGMGLTALPGGIQ